MQPGRRGTQGQPHPSIPQAGHPAPLVAHRGLSHPAARMGVPGAASTAPAPAPPGKRCDMTKSKSLTCAICAQPMYRGAQSLPQGQATCQPCRRENPRHGLNCARCGERMIRNTKSSLPQGSAMCRPCRRVVTATKQKQRPTRTCWLCGDSFEHSRNWYCSTFCRTLSKRSRADRTFYRLVGSFRPALWWHPITVVGPPRHLLDVWVTPDHAVGCPLCSHAMHPAGDGSHACHDCDLRVMVTEGAAVASERA